MEYRVNNAFIKKIYIEEGNGITRRVVLGTNDRLLVKGKYRDVAYACDENDDIVTGIVDITDKEVTVACEEIYNSLLTLRDEHISVTMSKIENNGVNLVVKRIELSNE